VSHSSSRPWYKHWWGVILAVLIWPIFLTWFVWARSNWHIVGKIAATAVIVFVLLWIYGQLELLQILHTISHNSRNLPLQSPAYTLAAYDLGHTPNASTVAQYQSVLDGLAPHCTESEEKLAAEVWIAEQDLQKNGITNESNLYLLEDIRNAFAVRDRRADCIGFLPVHLWLHEPLIRQ